LRTQTLRNVLFSANLTQFFRKNKNWDEEFSQYAEAYARAAFPFGGRGKIKFSKDEASARQLRKTHERIQREIIWAASTRNETLM